MQTISFKCIFSWLITTFHFEQSTILKLVYFFFEFSVWCRFNVVLKFPITIWKLLLHLWMLWFSFFPFVPSLHLCFDGAISFLHAFFARLNPIVAQSPLGCFHIFLINNFHSRFLYFDCWLITIDLQFFKWSSCSDLFVLVFAHQSLKLLLIPLPRLQMFIF